MISFTRRAKIAAKVEAKRLTAREPVRYDRRFVFLLLLISLVLILSHAVLEKRFEPAVGAVMDEDIYAPPGFVYVDEYGARQIWEEEFKKLPEPYKYSDVGFSASSSRLLRYLSSEPADSALADLIVPDPARRAKILRYVKSLVDKARIDGLLEKTYSASKKLRILNRAGMERIVESSEVLQPGDWAKHLPQLEEDELARISGLLDKFLSPTLKYDEELAARDYEKIKQRHPPRKVTFHPEAPLVLAGQELGERQVEILRQMEIHMERRNYIALAALAGFISLTLTIGVLFVKRFLPAVYEKVRDIASISFAFGVVILINYLVQIVASKVEFGTLKFTNAILPAASLALALTLIVNARIAIIFSILASLIISAVLAPRPILLTMFVFGSLVAVLTGRSIRRRSDIFQSGFWIAVVQSLVVLLAGTLHGEHFEALRVDILSAAVSGFLASAIAQALLLPLEAISHRVSNFTLLELSDLNHPLLQQLLRKAPGTFQHSQHLALLAASAAEAIGANSLLARVGAYFHDIGKMDKPEYFTENQSSNENPHDRIKPSLSAAVIRNHVLDGVGFAESARLPSAVIDFIWQHHGTGLISVFYRRALELAGEDEEVNRADYQYPGPKPQVTETGILMLADAVEAATRSIVNPTATKIERMVKKIIADVFESGQLDECELTLKDLTQIADDFTRTLCAMYHTRRVSYPEADEIAEAEKNRQG